MTTTTTARTIPTAELRARIADLFANTDRRVTTGDIVRAVSDDALGGGVALGVMCRAVDRLVDDGVVARCFYDRNLVAYAVPADHDGRFGSTRAHAAGWIPTAVIGDVSAPVVTA